MEFQILTKPKIANKQNYVKNLKSRHEFCELGNILDNKIQFFICKIEIITVPTSFGSSEA